MNREPVFFLVVVAALSGLSGTVSATSRPSHVSVTAERSARHPLLSAAVTPATSASSHGAVSQNEEQPTHKGDPIQGKQIYANDCSMCHQPDRTGLPPSIPSLVGVVDRLGEKKVRDAAKLGLPNSVPPMPSHPDLSDADLDHLIAYLNTK